MTIHRRLLAVGAAALLLAQPAVAAEIAGTWKAEFDTQVGMQKYTYVFAMDGEALTGKASFERMGQTGEVELQDCTLEGDTVSFTEPLSFQGNEIPITYTGTVAGDAIEFTRKVGDFAEEKFTATRAEE